VGLLMRRPAGAIAVVVALLLVSAIVAENLPAGVGRWVALLSPVGAGFALMNPPSDCETIPSPVVETPTVSSPAFAGLALVAVALGLLDGGCAVGTPSVRTPSGRAAQRLIYPLRRRHDRSLGGSTRMAHRRDPLVWGSSWRFDVTWHSCTRSNRV